MRLHGSRRWSGLAAVWLLMGTSLCLGQTIPQIPQLAREAWNFQSPLWEKAAKVDGFAVPAQGGAKPAPASQATEVRLAHDGTNLYVRYTAFDTEMAKVKAGELDEFADVFPQGDHGEIWAGGDMTVLAFDPNGNKYDAQHFDRGYFSGFLVKSRKLADRWETILVIPLKAILYRGKVASKVSLAFVRHLDHGEKTPQRSTASGKPPTAMASFTLE